MVKEKLPPEAFLALFEMFSFEKIVDAWLSEEILQIPEKFQAAYTWLREQLNQQSKAAWKLYTPILYNILKEELFPEWFIKHQEISDEFKIRFAELENDPSFQKMKKEYGKEAYVRIMHPENFTPQALAAIEEKKAKIAEAEQLPEGKRFPRLYEIGGKTAVLASFKKMISALHNEQKIMAFEKELQDFLIGNEISLSTFEMISLATAAANRFPATRRDNTAYLIIVYPQRDSL